MISKSQSVCKWPVTTLALRAPGPLITQPSSLDDIVWKEWPAVPAWGWHTAQGWGSMGRRPLQNASPCSGISLSRPHCDSSKGYANIAFARSLGPAAPQGLSGEQEYLSQIILECSACPESTRRCFPLWHLPVFSACLELGHSEGVWNTVLWVSCEHMCSHVLVCSCRSLDDPGSSGLPAYISLNTPRGTPAEEGPVETCRCPEQSRIRCPFTLIHSNICSAFI